jgi:hypothetical protein
MASGRRPPLLLATLLACGLLWLAAARPVGAQTGDDTTDDTSAETTDDTPVPAQDIIPEPDSGRPPEDAGDRGGALQGLVFVLILVGVGGITAIVVRESRRSRERQPSP